MKLYNTCKIKTVFGNCEIDEIFIEKSKNDFIIYGKSKKSKQKHAIILINKIDLKNLLSLINNERIQK